MYIAAPGRRMRIRGYSVLCGQLRGVGPERGVGGKQLASGLNDPPRSGAIRWGEKAGEGVPSGAPAHRRPPDAQDDHLETSSTSTCCSLQYFHSCSEFIDAARAHVGESFSMPSSAVGSVGNDKGAVYCFLFIPPSVAWAAGLSRWGYPPSEPGPPA